MAYEKIAEGIADGLTLEIWELDATPQEPIDLIVTGFVEKKGISTPDKYREHLPFEVQLGVIDYNRFLRERLRNAPPDRFKLIVKDGEADYAELFLSTSFSSQEYHPENTVRELSAHDGITLLRAMPPVTGTWQIGLLIEELLHMTGITYDVIITSDITHGSAAGQNGIIPNRWRVKNADGFIRGRDGNAYEQLMAVLRYLKFQVFQEDGIWRVVEREARAGSTINVYNISQDTAGTEDPNLTLIESDVRKRAADNNDKQLSLISRLEDNKASSYEFPNGELDAWAADELLDWNIVDDSAFQRIDQGDETGIEIIANSSMIMNQFPLYSLSFRDKIRFRFYMEFDWTSGLPSGQNWTVEVARVLLVGHGGSTSYGFNQSTQDWDSGSDGIISASINTDSYITAQTISFDVELETPSYGRIQVEVFWREDTGLVNSDPVLLRCDFAGEHIIKTPKTTLFTADLGAPGADLKEEVSIVERSVAPDALVFAYSDLQIYNGTSWVDSGSNEFGDVWDGFRKLSELIVNKMAASSLTPDHLVDLHIDHTKSLQMMSTVTYEINSIQRVYIPHFIQHNRLTHRRRVMLIQAKSETVDPPVMTHE